jgi:membrane-bound ClpP family serine protease
MGATNKRTNLDQVVNELEPRQSPNQDSYARPSIVALATSVGLILFLIAYAQPGGLSGVAGFVIGFIGVIALVSIAIVAAIINENHQRRLHHQRVIVALLAAMIQDREDAHSERGRKKSSTSDDISLREVLRILEQLYRELPK